MRYLGDLGLTREQSKAFLERFTDETSRERVIVDLSKGEDYGILNATKQIEFLLDELEEYFGPESADRARRAICVMILRQLEQVKAERQQKIPENLKITVDSKNESP